MIIAKKLGLATIQFLLVGIPCSFVLGGLWWFFTGLVLQMDTTPYLITVRTVYIVLAILLLVIQIVDAIRLYSKVFTLMRSLKLPYKVVEKGVHEYEVHKLQDFDPNDGEAFQNAILSVQLTRDIAASVVSIMSGLGRFQR